jgi:hypothetical protein
MNPNSQLASIDQQPKEGGEDVSWSFDRFARNGDMPENVPYDPADEEEITPDQLADLPEGFEHYRFRIKPEMAHILQEAIGNHDHDDDDDFQ